MKRVLLVIFAALALLSCDKSTDRMLSPRGWKIRDVKVIVSTETVPGHPRLTLRHVSFVNMDTAPITVGAIETSRVSIDGPEVWSLQPSSTEERKDWLLPVEKGFYQRNYLGMNGSDYGGGIPMVSLWNASDNISVGVAEPVLKLVSMPVSRIGSVTSACIREDFEEPVVLAPRDTLRACTQFIIKGHGDFFSPLQTFAAYMHEVYGYEAPHSPAEAYEPVWCAWGYERTFTVDEVIGTLPKVVELGFKWVDVDDGYQICEGDWQTNDRIGPDGMRRMTDAIHEAGLKAKLWWAPIAADPESSIAKEHPEMLLVKADGSHEDISWWDSWYLSPVNPHTWAYTEGLVDMFLNDWGFDGFKLDGQHLNLSAPDYNPESGLERPEEACERLPEFFRHLYERAQEDRPGAVVQICPCGDALNFFITPWMNQAVASDPTSSAQIRMKRKVENKKIRRSDTAHGHAA